MTDPTPDLTAKEVQEAFDHLRSPHAWERFGAAMAFGNPERNLGIPRSADFVKLLAPLLEDEDSYARLHAAESLGRLGYADALPALEVALQSERAAARVGRTVVMRAIEEAVARLRLAT